MWKRKNNKPNAVLCLNCALIFDDAEACPECSHVVDKQLYGRSIELARDAAVFGYSYRKAFEREQAKGNHHVRFALEVHEVLIFLALAVVSGIVGNAAYDVSKMAFLRIASQIRTRYSKERELIQLRIFDDEEKTKEFIRYVSEFPRILKELPSEVREAIFEEMVVDKIVDRLTPHLRTLSPEKIADARQKAFQESVEEVAKQLKIAPDQMDSFWKRVPKLEIKPDDPAA